MQTSRNQLSNLWSFDLQDIIGNLSKTLKNSKNQVEQTGSIEMSSTGNVVVKGHNPKGEAGNQGLTTEKDHLLSANQIIKVGSRPKMCF